MIQAAQYKLPFEYKLLRRMFSGDYGLILVERLSGLGPRTPRFYTYRIQCDAVPPVCQFPRAFATLEESDYEERSRDLIAATRGIES